jgi:FAD/FMN-containing dehydrogenase
VETITYEAVRRNPELLNELLQNARRERSRAVHRLVSRALRALFWRPRRPAAALALRTSACG